MRHGKFRWSDEAKHLVLKELETMKTKDELDLISGAMIEVSMGVRFSQEKFHFSPKKVRIFALSK